MAAANLSDEPPACAGFHQQVIKAACNHFAAKI